MERRIPLHHHYLLGGLAVLLAACSGETINNHNKSDVDGSGGATLTANGGDASTGGTGSGGEPSNAGTGSGGTAVVPVECGQRFCLGLVEPIPVGPNPRDAVTIDCNGDSHRDVVVTNSDSNSISVMTGNGDGTFAAQRVFDAGDKPWEVQVGDFNEDGIEDLAFGNFVSGANVVLGEGNCGFAAPLELFGDDPLGEFSGGSYAAGVGDINGDGHDDVLSQMTGPGGDPSYIAMSLGKGDGTFEDFTTLETSTSPHSLRVMDIDLDGNNDILGTTSRLWGNSSGQMGQLHVVLGDGEGGHTLLPDRSLLPEVDTFDVGDFDGDGALDVVTASEWTEDFAFVRGNGDGTFAPPVTTSFSGYATTDVATADFDRDGHLDVAISSGNHNEVWILAGRGDGTFEEPWVLTSGDYSTADSDDLPGNLTVDDLNGDGYADILGVNYAGEVSVLLSGAWTPEQGLGGSQN